MRTWVPLSLAVLLAAIGCQVAAQNKLVMCYYTNWSQYRSGRTFFPEQIDPTYCTHLVYSFAKLVGNRLTTYEWNEILDYTDGLYKRFNALKRQKPGLKTLLAVGGFSARSEGFSAMASTAANRQEFVTTTITWLRDNDFDGLDIDWEYPGHAGQGGKPEDKVNFVLLCQDLRNGFDAEARATGREKLMLTAAVAAGYSTVSDGYDIPNLNKYLDHINIMSYDLHGAWDAQTGHNAGLFTSSTDSSRFSVADTAENWVAGGATPSKTLVGLATYGRTWTLSDPTDTRVGAPAKGPGKRGEYSRESGYLTYYEVCEVAFKGGYTLDFDQESKVPYAHKGDQWITYDDVNSLQYKMSWINSKGFGGAIVWAIELDDFDGNSCGVGKYPLMRAIRSCLIDGQNCAPGDGGVVTAAPTTQRPTTPTPPPTQPPTTQRPTTVPTTRRPVYTTRRPWYTRPTTTRRPWYTRPATTRPTTTRRPWYTRPTTTRRPVYTRAPTTTRRPWYTRAPTTTRRPVYTRPPTTRRPVLTPATTTAPPTTVVSPGIDAQCPANYGFFRDLEDCGVFWFCWLPYRWRYVCPPGTQFDQRYFVCSYNSDCKYPLGLRG